MKYFTAFILILITSTGYCQSITVTGGWTLTVSSSDISDAGSDYGQNYTSSSSQTTIDTVDPGDLLCLGITSSEYEIHINKSDTNWDSQLELYAIRTGNGSPVVACVGCGASGGQSYILIENTAKVFFNVTGCRVNIPIQYELRGVSVTIPADTYQTDVIYTLIDI